MSDCAPCEQREADIAQLKTEIAGIVQYAEDWIKNYGGTPGLSQLTHDEQKCLAGMKQIAELVETRL